MTKVVELPINECDVKIFVGADGVWMHFGNNTMIHIHNTLGNHDGIVARNINNWCIARQKQADFLSKKDSD